MDSMIAAAARALAQGDPLGALNRVALREDPAALALRGIAMAQLGDFVRAKTLLRKAARGFGAKEAMARARCIVAEAEVALASRELAWPTKALDAARLVLEAHADWVNAAHARQLAVKRLVLLGHLDDAEALLNTFDVDKLPLALQAAHYLMSFGIAVRRLKSSEARVALERARIAADTSGIPALNAEVQSASHVLNAPTAQLIVRGETRSINLDAIEALYASKALVVDMHRYAVSAAGTSVSLARRPVLFAIVRTLAEVWPNDVHRKAVIEKVFRTRHGDESHRARLRVEIGRLRHAIKTFANVQATKDGYVLEPLRSKEVALLARLVDNEYAAVLALLADGEAWSSSALALAVGASQRSIQRALDALGTDGKIQALGQGRARRWITAPLPGFATALLLPGPLPGN